MHALNDAKPRRSHGRIGNPHGAQFHAERGRIALPGSAAVAAAGRITRRLILHPFPDVAGKIVKAIGVVGVGGRRAAWKEVGSVVEPDRSRARLERIKAVEKVRVRRIGGFVSPVSENCVEDDCTNRVWACRRGFLPLAVRIAPV